MSQPQSAQNYPPEIKGYRIRQYVRTEQESPASQETLLKVLVKNESNGIPKIRNDVICNGKHYPFLPLFTFTSEDDLKIIEQISTIVLRDENQILCEILSGKINQVTSTQFKDLKVRFKSVFSLQLKIDPEELFLIVISDQIVKENELNDIFDSISETEFVNLLKKIFQNCPSRVIPKILRKIAKYFNTTSGRSITSIERLKKVLKIIKLADESPEVQERQEIQSKPVQKSSSQQEEEWVVIPKSGKKASTKKQTILVSQKVKQKQEKSGKKEQETLPTPKKIYETVKVEQQKFKQKVTQTQKFKKTQKVTQKQKVVRAENITSKKQKQKVAKNQPQKIEQNDQNWQDVDESDQSDEQFHLQEPSNEVSSDEDSSDQDLKYQVPKKKGKKNKNANIYLDPQIERGIEKKQSYSKKQKKNAANNSNFTNQGKQKRPQRQQEDQFDRRNSNNKQQFINKNKSYENGRVNQEQSGEKGRRQFSKEGRKLDSRILLGINGACDSVWREKLRPPRYINRENNSGQYNRQNIPYEKSKQNNWFEKSKTEGAKPNFESSKQKGKQVNANEQKPKNQSERNKNEPTSQQVSKNLSLQKIFSIPDDVKQGKQFKFEKRNYNLFVNKLFWVNISGDQVTVQKEGKGYIRKCPVEIIDNGKAIVAEGVTINTDGLSNLEDGGTAFGNPVFEEFTPEGQWFLIHSLDVFAYL